jgi:hypothetical protein
VVGGQSVVRDDEVSAEILGRVVLEAARGRHPALALREAVLAHLTEHPPGRRAPPSRWANLTVWTSQPRCQREQHRTIVAALDNHAVAHEGRQVRAGGLQEGLQTV